MILRELSFHLLAIDVALNTLELCLSFFCESLGGV